MKRGSCLALALTSLVACSSSSDNPSPDDNTNVTDEDDATDVETPRVNAMWVGAHPDDESYIAPLLASQCVGGGGQCTLVVFTRGENGKCKRPELCSTNLADVRAQELEASADLLGAELVALAYEDLDTGVSAVSTAWAEQAGGAEPLLAQIRDLVIARAPDVIYTFDPRHGTTCHSAHQTAGALVYLALEDTPYVDAIRLLESRVEVDAATERLGIVPFVPEDSSVVRFDAAATENDREPWAWFVDVLVTHASQYTDAEVDAVRDVPSADRAVFTLDVGDVRDPDARYEDLCP